MEGREREKGREGSGKGEEGEREDVMDVGREKMEGGREGSRMGERERERERGEEREREREGERERERE